MKATSFTQTNKVFMPGGNPNTDQLAVCIADDPQIPGPCFIVNRFKMSPEEREAFLANGDIWLSVMANQNDPTFQPVMLTAFNPFTDLGFIPKEL